MPASNSPVVDEVGWRLAISCPFLAFRETARRRFRGPSLWTGMAVILVSLILRLIALDNGLEAWQLRGGDLITHQYTQAQLRFANTPGYPLYAVLGWVWFQWGRVILSPWFNPTEILSVFSTAFIKEAVEIWEIHQKNRPQEQFQFLWVQGSDMEQFAVLLMNGKVKKYIENLLPGKR